MPCRQNMIKDNIQKAIFENLKAKRETEVKVLRFLLSQIKYEEINKQKELTDQEIVVLFQKEVKKRKEAIEMFRSAGRNDLVYDEEKQLEVISRYIPKPLTEDELTSLITEEIKNSAEPDNAGVIMGSVMKRVQGRADGAKVFQLIKERISPTS